VVDLAATGHCAEHELILANGQNLVSVACVIELRRSEQVETEALVRRAAVVNRRLPFADLIECGGFICEVSDIASGRKSSSHFESSSHHRKLFGEEAVDPLLAESGVLVIVEAGD
jgi:hypothetical protein